MKIERLVQMANDIGAFYNSEPDREAAIEGVADHLRRFWDPRMRCQIIDHLHAGGEGLDDLARAAVSQLEVESV